MKRIISILVIVLLFQVGAFSQADAIQALIIQISSKKSDWMVKQNIDSLEALMDDQFLFIHSNGWTQTKKDFFNDFVTGKLNYRHIESKEASVRIYNDTAVLTGKGEFGGEVDGKPFELSLIYTEVYVLKDNRWRFVSRQSTRLP